ncbi:MAG: hypothetical protein JWM11_6257 [Planctomycetaceae bacterium]|nr:hypothetical protein [Planctomycetaceae bacterium]
MFGHILFLMILVWSFVPPSAVLGRELAPAGLSPEIRGAIGWLPTDSDTLHVAQAFEMPGPEPQKQVGPLRDFRYGGQLFVLEGLFEPVHKKYLKPLGGRKVLVAVRGERNSEVVSKFGSVRSEGCSIILFKDDLGTAAKEWTDLIRAGADQIRRHNGHEVFVLGKTTVMDGWVKPKPWQGTFLVLLTPKCLLCASSDKYLEYVLDHLESWSAVRAFPETLVEWQHVDTTAPGWMLHHVPAGSVRSIIGVTVTLTRDRCRIVYLPLDKTNQDPKEFVRNRWLGKDSIVDMATPYDFERAENGTISVSTGLEAFEPENWLLIWRLGSLQTES